MRITMICIGSMGDVKPYIVLGRELQNRGHRVTICAFSNFQSLAEENGMNFAAISGNVKAFMSDIMAPGAVGLSYVRQLRKTLRAIITPMLQDMEKACEDSEVIMTTFFGQMAQSLAEIKYVPFIQTHYFPMDRNPNTPISSMPVIPLGRKWNMITYDLGYLLISSLEKFYLTKWRKEHGMSPRKLEGQPNYQLNGHTIPVLYAISPLLMQRPVTWKENIHMTGFWIDKNETTDYEPPTALQDFINDGEPPIYIGFGSMTGNDIEGTLQLVLDSVAQSGVRAIIAKGWGGVSVPSSKNVFPADFIPHNWLFSRVSAVVHHGGAGTTAAGLLAGKPTLIISFGGDQVFWGKRVHALGLGPRFIPREKLTTARLTKGLIDLTQTKSYRTATAEMSQRLIAEDGVANAATIIDDEIRKWMLLEGRPSGANEGNDE